MFRFGALLTICYGIKRDGHRVTMNYLIMLSTCSFAMAVINVVLFKRIICKDLFGKSSNSNNTASVANGTNGHIEKVCLLNNNYDEDLSADYQNGDLQKQTELNMSAMGSNSIGNGTGIYITNHYDTKKLDNNSSGCSDNMVIKKHD